MKKIIVMGLIAGLVGGVVSASLSMINTKTENKKFENAIEQSLEDHEWPEEENNVETWESSVSQEWLEESAYNSTSNSYWGE